MLRFLKDLATSTVAVAPSPASSGTSITVQTGEGSFFPGSTQVPFYLVAHPDNELPTQDNAEFLLVTAVSSDTFTIDRAVPMGDLFLTAKNIAVGWRVSLPIVTWDLVRTECLGFIMYDPTPDFSVGDVIAVDPYSPAYIKANANDPLTSEVVGVVIDRNDNFCEVITNGKTTIPNAYPEGSGGHTLYLSDITDGKLSYEEPTTPGHISKPVVTLMSESMGFVDGWVTIMRGMEIDEGWGSTSFISDATPAGLVNGTNTAFTVPEAYSAGTMEVFINGLKQIRDTDYTETNPTTGSFTISPAPASGDIVRVNYMTGAFGTGNADTVDGYHASQLMTPIGSIMDYGGATAPTGWLLCYGQAISRTTYAALFAVLGTTYGVGDGSTTFNVPDLRGRVVAGQDDMGGTSANRLTGTSGSVDGDILGGTGGAETHTLSAAEMPVHSHQQIFTAGTSGSYGMVDSGAASSSGTNRGNTGNAGSGSAHNNVQPTIILNKIIRAL